MTPDRADLHDGGILEGARLAAHRCAMPLAALLMVDLDAFKRVNDERGHAAGAIGAAVRPDDRVVRWGGDEILVLTAGVGAADAQALAERVATSVAAAAAADGVSASIGVAVREGHEPWRATFDRADAGLYAAERQSGSGSDRALAAP